MAKGDTFTQLIKGFAQGQLQDDSDPNNTVISQFATPFDNLAQSESVRWFTSQSWVWSDGTTYTAYDNAGNAWDAPSCGWLWGAGGRWGGVEDSDDYVLTLWPVVYQ